MKLAARGYVVTKGKGNRNECVTTMRSLHRRCVELRKTHPQTGFWLRLINNEDDIVDEMLDEFHIPEMIDNEYPVLFVNVTFTPDKFDYRELTDLERKFEMTLIATGETE